jgi:hypothetical protein
MDLYLDGKETDLVQRLLSHRLEELHHEIHHTDRRAFKAELKDEELVLERLLQKVKTPSAIGI